MNLFNAPSLLTQEEVDKYEKRIAPFRNGIRQDRENSLKRFFAVAKMSFGEEETGRLLNSTGWQLAKLEITIPELAETPTGEQIIVMLALQYIVDSIAADILSNLEGNIISIPTGKPGSTGKQETSTPLDSPEGTRMVTEMAAEIAEATVLLKDTLPN